MKASPQLTDFSRADSTGVVGTYPPLGFLPVLDAELGNGDYLGFYWPYGHEDREPLVCEMLHDEWGMRLAFSSAAIFLEWLAINDGDRGDQTIDDPELVVPRFQGVKPLLQQHPEEAISRLKAICEDFPECAEYWFTLAGQLRRVGDLDGAGHAAIRAFASNWSFGMPPNGVLKMLQNAKGHVDDPLVACSDRLPMKFGGEKENTCYHVIKDCIDAYLSSSTPVLGLLLNQNYGYMMSMETVSFQERYHFDRTTWINDHSQLCSQYLGDSRTQIG